MPDLLLVAACVAAVRLFGLSVVLGGSMEPVLRQGDVVLYRRGGVPRRGDLVVLAGRPVGCIHRVMRVTERGELVTKGDANPVPDLRASAPSSVRGTVVAVLPSGGAGLVGRGR